MSELEKKHTKSKSTVAKRGWMAPADITFKLIKKKKPKTVGNILFEKAFRSKKILLGFVSNFFDKYED